MSEKNEVKAPNLEGRGSKASRENVKSYISRLENLEADKAAIGEDIKSVYAEMKSDGYDTKAIRKCIRERKKKKTDREMEQISFDLYWGIAEEMPTKEDEVSSAIH